MDRLDAMRQFVRVAELGSFSAAAQQQGLARSLVTRQIAALESHLGTQLIVRSTRRLALTSAGADYLEKCRAILNLVDVAESDVAADRQIPRGPVRLSIPLSFGMRFLTSPLLEFLERYPEVTLDVDYIDRHSNLIGDGIDVAVRLTRRLGPHDVARRLGAIRLGVVASPEYLARHGEPGHPSELIRHEALAYTGSGTPQHWEFEIDGRLQLFPVRASLQANNGEALVQAAVAGRGLAYTPLFMAQDALASGRLQQILQDVTIAELGIYAVLPSNRHMPHRVRSLIDFLALRLGAHPDLAARAQRMNAP